MRYVVTVMLIVVAVIHLLPLSGVLSGERLAALYGIPFNEPNLEHRDAASRCAFWAAGRISAFRRI